jgi:transcriptional regulator with XRE-family HTH domain
VPRTPATHVDDPKSMGRRLREARLAAGLSQRALAFSGCTAAYVSRIESGARVPSLQLIHEFARRLGVPPEYLATGAEVDSLPDDLIDAQVALRLGEIDRAEQIFRERLEQEPRNPVALAGLGHAAYRREDPATAIDLLEQALALRDDAAVADPTAVETLARAYAGTGALEAAVVLLERAVEQADAHNAIVEALRFRVLLANALIDSGSVAHAEQILAAAIRESEEMHDPLAAARVYWTQSRLHTHHKDPKLGARYARRALEILERTENDAYVAMAYHLLAYAEIEAGRPEAALEQLEHGREIFGRTMTAREDAKFALEETRALLALDRLPQAARMASYALGKLSALDPQDQGRSYILLGEVFHRSGDQERAIELLELAVELLEEAGRPYVVEAASKLADVLEEAGRSDQALKVLRRAVAAGKSDTRART